MPVTRGLDLEHTTVPPAYNYPAAINTHKWDYFVDASFIYWHVSEEFLEAGIDYKTQIPDPSMPDWFNITSGTQLSPRFAYRPGFKVGFGVDTPFDDWAIVSEWTRISEEITTHYHTGATDIWEDSWTSSGANNTPQYTKWSFHLNLFDLSLQRPFYQGKRLIVSPLMGLRGITLKQNMKKKTPYTFMIENTSPQVDLEGFFEYNYQSHLWGIGPRLGADLEWLLYKEFRIIGSGTGSLLYTKYTSNGTKYRETQANNITPFIVGPAPVKIPQFSALRANLEYDLGFGWGMYFSDQKYHIDFTATYDFQAFFKMNVMSALTTSWVGDIYLHGLTVSGRFDF